MVFPHFGEDIANWVDLVLLVGLLDLGLGVLQAESEKITTMWLLKFKRLLLRGFKALLLSIALRL